MIISLFVFVFAALDESKPPCVNFYQHVCNDVVSKKILEPTQERYWFAGDDSYRWWLAKKSEFLQSLVPLKKISSRQQHLRNFYLSCMNSDDSTRSELEAFRSLNSRLNKLTDKEGFLEFVGQEFAATGRHFFQWFVRPDINNPQQMQLILNFEPQLLSKHLLRVEPSLKVLKERVLKNFYSSIDQPSADQFVTKFLVVEEKLHLATAKKGAFKSDFSSAEILRKYPNLHLKNFFSLTSKKDFKIRISGAVGLDEFYQAFDQLSLLDLKVAYVLYAFYQEPEDSWPDFLASRREFEKQVHGISRPYLDREERCAHYASIYLDRELDHEILKSINLAPYRFATKEIAEKTRKSFSQILLTSDLVNSIEKRRALEKLKNLKMNLVAPVSDSDWDFLKLPTKLPESFYQMRIDIRRSAIRRELALLDKPISRSRWRQSPLQQEVWYQPESNAIFVPLGFLRPPVFDLKSSAAQNFGGLASLIGHEISHGFDLFGLLFDEKGKRTKWITQESLSKLSKRAQPLDQDLVAAGYPPVRSLAELMADFNGLEMSWHTVKKMPLAERQKFFIQYASRWCQVIDPQYLSLVKKREVHPQGEERVNLILKRFEPFRETFKCTEKSDGIKIW